MLATLLKSPDLKELRSKCVYVMQANFFVTCIIDQIYPEVGESTVRVLKRLGVDLRFPNAQTCCGQPAFNSGFWKDAKPIAKHWVDQFDGNLDVVVPSGSCATMVRVFYNDLFRDDHEYLRKFQRIRGRVYELSEYIVDVLGIDDISKFAKPSSNLTPRKITYHEACHLKRELGIETQPRTLIKSCPGVDLVEMRQSEVCCGFGGTFSIKYPDISGAMLQDKIANAEETQADTITACDSSCLMQIDGGLRKQNSSTRTVHIAQLLDEVMNQTVQI